MRWIVGTNAPGYLPVDEPVACETWQEAVAQLRAEMETTRDVLFEDGDASADYRLNQALEALDYEVRKGFPMSMSFQLFDIAHWIEAL